MNLCIETGGLLLVSGFIYGQSTPFVPENTPKNKHRSMKQQFLAVDLIMGDG